MHRVFNAALELQAVLGGTGYPFCFIGGLALQRWGEPRMTKDADATVVTAFEHDEELINLLLSKFESRRADAADFARRNRVLLIRASNGVGLDVALGALEFEIRSTGRAIPWKTEDGVTIRICTADDLVVHKAFANREHDWGDIRSILLRQGRKLNEAQIFGELEPLVMLKEDDSIVPKLKRLMQEYALLK